MTIQTKRLVLLFSNIRNNNYNKDDLNSSRAKLIPPTPFKCLDLSTKKVYVG